MAKTPAVINKLTKGIQVHVPFLWMTGITIFPFILKRHKANLPTLVRHERIHLRQQLEMLIIPFYVWYLTEYLVRRLGGKNHQQAYKALSHEQEAYSHQASWGYLGRRKPYAWLKWLFRK